MGDRCTSAHTLPWFCQVSFSPSPLPLFPSLLPLFGGLGGEREGGGRGAIAAAAAPREERGGQSPPPPAFIAVCPLVRQKISRIYLKIKLKNIYNYKIFCIYLDKVLV